MTTPSSSEHDLRMYAEKIAAEYERRRLDRNIETSKIKRSHGHGNNKPAA